MLVLPSLLKVMYTGLRVLTAYSHNAQEMTLGRRFTITKKKGKTEMYPSLSKQREKQQKHHKAPSVHKSSVPYPNHAEHPQQPNQQHIGEEFGMCSRYNQQDVPNNGQSQQG